MEGVAGFDWDEGNREKCEWHGVAAAAIESIFLGPVTVFPDSVHSTAEERLKAIGRTSDRRHVLIVFTFRMRDEERPGRPISARYMHRKEVAYYEEEAAKLANR
ncbi:MAG: BrnT family toxin [Caulobacteraceae bacterium]